MAIRKVKLPDGTYVDVYDNRIVLTSPSEGQLMKYDSETGNIVNEDAGFIPDPGPVSVNDGDIIEGIVQDYDGNWYNGVVLNNQIWLKENLRVTHNPNGDAITYYHVNNDPLNDGTYGLQYDWTTMMNGASSSDTVPSGVQGIAPNGWHIPSDAEWTQFTTYIGNQPQYICDNNNQYIAKALASTIGWNESENQYAVGNNLSANNATGFSALPAGGNGNTVYVPPGYNALLWSATESSGSNAYGLLLGYSYATVASYSNDKYVGFSVRCVMNMSASDWFAQNINRLYLKYTTNGVVWNQLSSVAESGSYNDLLDKPTIPAAQVQSDWNQTDSSAVDYIKNKPTIPTVRTMNGEQLTDSSLGDINLYDGFYFPNAVQDYDGNWYGAVVIGEQVWLGENLRTTHMPDGTAITESSGYNHANNDSDNDLKYGLLYSINIVLNGEGFDDSIPSSVQGISPDGWHIPSVAETDKLITYLSKQHRFNLWIQDGNKYIAKSMVSTYGWSTTSAWYCPGNDLSSNNAAGLNIPPSGSDGSTLFNKIAIILTSSNPISGYQSKVVNIGYGQSYVNTGGSAWGAFGSVRCVSNLTPIQFRNWYIEQYGSLQHILPAAQIQSDWNQTDSNAPDFIKNKPDISTVTFRFW